MKRKLKIMVTGGAGFIGSNLIKELVKQGHEVHSLDNYDSGKKENEVYPCNYITGDIEVLDWYNTPKFDLCFHLAALSRIQPSYDQPQETFRVNTKGTLSVLEWAKRNDVRVVYSGSSSVHHNPTQSPYALFKSMGEDLCRLYRTAYNLDIEIVRFYNVYGKNEIIDGDWAAVIGIWRRQIRDGEKITIVGDGEQRRDFTNVSDIVDGLMKISEQTEHKKDAWELGTGVNYSMLEVFDMFKERFPHIEKVHLPQQLGNYNRTLREDDDALALLHWHPKDTLRNYILSL